MAVGMLAAAAAGGIGNAIGGYFQARAQEQKNRQLRAMGNQAQGLLTAGSVLGTSSQLGAQFGALTSSFGARKNLQVQNMADQFGAQQSLAGLGNFGGFGGAVARGSAFQNQQLQADIGFRQLQTAVGLNQQRSAAIQAAMSAMAGQPAAQNPLAAGLMGGLQGLGSGLAARDQSIQAQRRNDILQGQGHQS